MVFVFGIDIPLVELIFVLTLVLILLFGFMVYLVISQIHLSRKLKTVIDKENTELSLLRTINLEEKKELGLITAIRNALNKLLGRRPRPRRRKKVEKVVVVRRVQKRRPARRVVRKRGKIYLATKDGTTVHETNCPFAKRIDPHRRVVFRSKTAAFNKGYRACACIKSLKKR